MSGKQIMYAGYILLMVVGIWFLSSSHSESPSDAHSDVAPVLQEKAESSSSIQVHAVATEETQPEQETIQPTPQIEEEVAPAQETQAVLPEETQIEEIQAEEPVTVVESQPVELEEVAQEKVESEPLSDMDCNKCHPNVVSDVDTRGGLHKSDAACLDCHLEHPPLGKEVIPACEMCHSSGDSPHYAIDGCGRCHYPHYPMEMDFGAIDSPACLSCHPAQGVELEKYPSAHTDLDCVECHTVHKEWQACVDCHEPHTEEMAHKDCLACHAPHMPNEVKYDSNIPNNFCSCCHEEVGTALMASAKLHSGVGCVECHEGEHTAIIACEGCHDAGIHGKDMHTEFPECLKCHQDPHRLAE